MFEDDDAAGERASDKDVRRLGQELLATEDAECTAAEQVDRIAGWERVIAHAQAQQLAEMGTFAARRRVGGWAQPAENSTQRTYDSVNDEVALARRISAVTAALHLSLAQILANDLPCCAAAFDAGRISLHAVRVIVAETDVLSSDQRREVDAAIAAEAAQLTPGAVRDAIRARVLSADPAAAERRAAKARKDTAVGMVKRPDGVGLIYANLKAEDAVAVHTSLDDHARSRRAAGDVRSLNQLRVDTFVDRLTGVARDGKRSGATVRSIGPGDNADSGDNAGAERPDAGGPPRAGGGATDVAERDIAGATMSTGRRVTLNVVVSAATLLGLDDTPGMLTGYGHIAPGVVRDLLAGPDTWIRRLVADPIDGQVLTIDSRARKVTGLLRTFTDTRDGTCRRPFCTNPIDEGDHLEPYAEGGRTNHRNTDGLCGSCHRTRHAAGWTLTPEPGSARVWWTTPTGHTYLSQPPPAIGYGTPSHQLLRLIAQHGTGPPHVRHRRTAA